MGWIGKGSGKIIDYNGVGDLIARITDLDCQLACERHLVKQLNTYIERLTHEQNAPRKYRVTFNNGPSDVEVKATHFVASPENGYNFYDKTGVSKLTAHFDYDIVAYVLEITEN